MRCPRRCSRLSRWLASEHDEVGGWPGIAALAPARRAARAPWRDPAAVPGLARRDRSGAVTTPRETAQATTAILESGAIMLGAALVFVTIFRRLRLGATLGYIVAGALIGPHLLGLIQDPEQLTSVTEIGIALLLFIVGLELQPSRLWRLRHDIFGLGLLQVVLCGLAHQRPALFRAGHLARGGAGDRTSARPVIDRAGAADASRR